MIYTITFNPALDYMLQIQEFQKGKINRSKEEYILPGGKGINVSIVLKQLDIDSIALGFVAGFVGEEIERKVRKYGVKTDFIKVEDEISRINVKITTPFEETAINGKGPFLEQSYLQLLFQKIEKIEKGDMLILSGSVPEGIPSNIYQNICQKVEEKNVKIVVDAAGNLLWKTLQYNPFLVKPNQEELGEIFNVKISSQEEVIKYARKLQQQGAQNVLVSMGNSGSILLDKNGNSYRRKAIPIEEAHTVGAGDSMVAGFIAGYQLFGSYRKALQMGIAAATATAKSIFLATKEEIYEEFDKIAKI